MPLRCCPVCQTTTESYKCPECDRRGMMIPTMTHDQLVHRWKRYKAGRELLELAILAINKAEGR